MADFVLTRTMRRQHLDPVPRIERLEEDVDTEESERRALETEVRALTKQISETGNRVLVGISVAAIMFAVDMVVRVAS